LAQRAAAVARLSRKARNAFPRLAKQCFVNPVRRIVLAILAITVVLVAFFAFRSAEPAKNTKPAKPSKAAVISEPAKPVRLDIRCRHGFRSASLSIWIDGRLICEGKLAGKVKRRLVFKRKTQGIFTNTTAVGAGKHAIRVQVVSAQAGYNQTKEIEGEFVPEETKTLEIGFTDPANTLSLTLH
jgi:hypothetical protein